MYRLKDNRKFYRYIHKDLLFSLGLKECLPNLVFYSCLYWLLLVSIFTPLFDLSHFLYNMTQINTCKLIVIFRLYISSMILIEISKSIHKIDRRFHSLFDLNLTIDTNGSWRFIILFFYLNYGGHFNVKEYG